MLDATQRLRRVTLGYSSGGFAGGVAECRSHVLHIAWAAATMRSSGHRFAMHRGPSCRESPMQRPQGARARLCPARLQSNWRGLFLDRIAARTTPRAPRHHTAQHSLYARRSRQADRLRCDGPDGTVHSDGGHAGVHRTRDREPLDAGRAHRSVLAGRDALLHITGRPPYAVQRLADLRDAWSVEVLPPSRLVSGIPPALDALCLALVRIDPAQRPRTAFEVMSAFKRSAESRSQNPRVSHRRISRRRH
jgi:hypothetical protein